MVGLSHQAREPATLLAAIISGRILGTTTDTVRDLLVESLEPLSADHLRDLAHSYAKVDLSPSRWLAGEEAAHRDLIERLFSGQRLSLIGLQTFGDDINLPDQTVAMLQAARLNKRGLAAHLAKDLGANLIWYAQAATIMPRVASGVTRDEALADSDRLLAIARARAAAPLWEERPSLNHAVDDLPGLRGNLAELFEVDDDWIDYEWRVRGELDGLLVGIALELARRENKGEWPESLDGLAPRYLPELPVDRINGGALGYALVDGSPVVYSLGRDSDDDGGRLPAALDPKEEENPAQPDAYRPRSPLGRPLRDEERSWADGDWVLWSLTEPRYMQAR